MPGRCQHARIEREDMRMDRTYSFEEPTDKFFIVHRVAETGKQPTQFIQLIPNLHPKAQDINFRFRSHIMKLLS